MKTGIHPTYFDTCEIHCSCGNVIKIGSTKQKITTELCSKCHPFYTGQQKLVDTAGRVDKFRARVKTAQLHKIAKKEAEVAKKTRKTTIATKPKPKKSASRNTSKNK